MSGRVTRRGTTEPLTRCEGNIVETLVGVSYVGPPLQCSPLNLDKARADEVVQVAVSR